MFGGGFSHSHSHCIKCTMGVGFLSMGSREKNLVLHLLLFRSREYGLLQWAQKMTYSYGLCVSDGGGTNDKKTIHQLGNTRNRNDASTYKNNQYRVVRCRVAR